MYNEITSTVLLPDWPQTDTHTQKEMDLVGLYSALQLGWEAS